jgi:hypothetical protein
LPRGFLHGKVWCNRLGTRNNHMYIYIINYIIHTYIYICIYTYNLSPVVIPKQVMQVANFKRNALLYSLVHNQVQWVEAMNCSFHGYWWPHVFSRPAIPPHKRKICMETVENHGKPSRKHINSYTRL